MPSVCSEVRFCEKSRVKRSFWKLVTFCDSLVENWKIGLSLLVNVSWKTLVLEAWIVRGKRSFWRLVLSLLVKVLWKTRVLEAWIVTFGECLVENARFGSLYCHFW